MGNMLVMGLLIFIICIEGIKEHKAALQSLINLNELRKVLFEGVRCDDCQTRFVHLGETSEMMSSNV